MALPLKNLLDVVGVVGSKPWPTLVQQLRFRNRVNFKRPLPLHYNKKRMLVVTEPVLPPKPQVCENVIEKVPDFRQAKKIPEEDNPYAVFLAGKMRRDFNNHPMVAIFHYNHYTQLEYQTVRGMLFDAKFPMHIQQQLNCKVAQMALVGTRWAPVLPLCVSKVALGFCSDTNVSKLLKLLKKMPQFVLLALVYENRLLHKEDIERVASFSSLLSLQSQVSTSLNLPGMSLSGSLMAGQMALSHSLNTLTKDLKTGESSTSSSSDSDSSSSSGSDSD